MLQEPISFPREEEDWPFLCSRGETFFAMRCSRLWQDGQRTEIDVSDLPLSIPFLSIPGHMVLSYFSHFCLHGDGVDGYGGILHSFWVCGRRIPLSMILMIPIYIPAWVWCCFRKDFLLT